MPTYCLLTDNHGHFAITDLMNYQNPIYCHNQYYYYHYLDQREYDNEMININVELEDWKQELHNIGVLNRRYVPRKHHIYSGSKLADIMNDDTITNNRDEMSIIKFSSQKHKDRAETILGHKLFSTNNVYYASHCITNEERRKLDTNQVSYETI